MAKARRSSPRRPLVVRCGWCDEPLTDPSGGRRYCSDAHRQAAYRARHRPVPEGSEVEQLRAQVRALKTTGAGWKSNCRAPRQGP